MNSVNDINIHQLLAERHEIALIWGSEDVQSVRPDLNDQQCWDVLLQAEKCHDANYGINWEWLEAAAQSLFGPEPDDVDGGDHA